MSERTIDGLAAARRRGRTGGRKPKLGARQIEVVWEERQRGKVHPAGWGGFIGPVAP